MDNKIEKDFNLYARAVEAPRLKIHILTKEAPKVTLWYLDFTFYKYVQYIQFETWKQSFTSLKILWWLANFLLDHYFSYLQ